MNKKVEWRLEYHRLAGELLGFCRGIVAWKIPEELKDKIINFAEEKEQKLEKLIEKDEEGANNNDDSSFFNEEFVDG